MDSLAIAWWKRPELAITLDYGQKAAEAEKLASAQVCKELGIRHEIVAVDCSSLGSGDMAGTPPDAAAQTSDWWPYRNQLLITLASMRAISRGMHRLYIGTVCSDGESHLDGTPEFVQKMDGLMAYQEGHLRVVAPAIELSTAELIRLAGVPPGLLAWSHSCHKANIACGSCRGCNKYMQTYEEMGPEYSGRI
ncbi:7-cyano-7-deazaguanine synthase [Hydrogenophaga sp. ANAO-22]|uniref:7-cyano-7-deazaguanine synthase n=1 Tax=Hydrogenophaga sp. ANAO-22 TaxID=3166645 RepID=UPI0036D3853B